MNPISFNRHRFPPDTIWLAVWLSFRFTTSLRDVEEMPAERGIDVSYETVRRFVSTHSAIHNTFNIQRHLVSRKTMRHFRSRAFAEWDAV